jgi:hypothetical protein
VYREHPVQHERVEVDVEIEGASERCTIATAAPAVRDAATSA